MTAWLADTRTSYDAVAAAYADLVRDATGGDRYMAAALTLFADVSGGGPGGTLLLGFHAGDGSRLKTSGYGGHPMNVQVYRRPPARVAAWLSDAGFTVEAELLFGAGKSAILLANAAG